MQKVYGLMVMAVIVAGVLWARDLSPWRIPVDEFKGTRFEQAGEDLVVSQMVTVNNSPHVLHTRMLITPDGDYQLTYIIIQNADLYNRSQKDVLVSWRIPEHIKSDAIAYRTDGEVIVLKTEELKRLVR